MTSPDRATEIRDRALKAVADRIAALGPDYHPACIPIVAANVAMASCLDQILESSGGSIEDLMADVADLCAPHAMWRQGDAR